MTFRFTAPTPLRWVDIDSEGVVNNAVYLSLMEQARFHYFTQLGLLDDGFALDKVEDVLLRLDYLSVDNLSQ